ncbi:MAG TPA: hypothetical protein VM536_12730 [Chloroflexia bacterium]|nr:hypothetical protein [Chloroflexia bacterium]
MDIGSIIQRFTGGNPPQDAHPETGNWLQNYQNGNHDQVPHDQVHQAYQQWHQTVPPPHQQEALQWGFQQVPQQQLPEAARAIHNVYQQNGLDPRAAGVQTTDPHQMTHEDLARLTQHAQQQQPDAIGQLFQKGGALSNPLVGMALAGALAYGATKFRK